MTLDVEALLDATAANANSSPSPSKPDDLNSIRSPSDRERDRNRTRDRDHDQGSQRDGSRDGDRRRPVDRDDDAPRERPRHRDRDRERDHSSSTVHSRHRSRSRDADRRRRHRSRSRSPRRNRRDSRDRYDRDRRDRDRRDRDRERDRERERDRDRDRERERDRDRDHDRGRRRGGRDRDRRRQQEALPTLTEEERDRRTVFVQQLAARLRTHELKEFFEQVGPVTEAQIVKDRISGRSKGVGYVEFKSEDLVPKAIQLTGQRLLGIPVIVQLTEAEKNRLARAAENGGDPTANGGSSLNGSLGLLSGNASPVGVLGRSSGSGSGGGLGLLANNLGDGILNGSGKTSLSAQLYNRLYVGNIHFNITEQDLKMIFEPFGELDYIQLQRDESNRSRGYGFVQFRDAKSAKDALVKMNGFELAGRNIRVGLGNDKNSDSTHRNGTPSSNGQSQSSSSGHGRSGSGGGGSSAPFDRIVGGRDEKKNGVSALDDSDVAGVNFDRYSRDSLMRKLARVDQAPPQDQTEGAKSSSSSSSSLPVSQTSRCVVLHNMFDPAEEEGEGWVQELEEDVREEAESKYGHVVHIAVDPESRGDIYVKFDKVEGGEKAILGLNGRFFGGRTISAAPVVDAVYSSMFSRARAM